MIEKKRIMEGLNKTARKMKFAIELTVDENEKILNVLEKEVVKHI